MHENLEHYLTIGTLLRPFSFRPEHATFIENAVQGYAFKEQPYLKDGKLILSFGAPRRPFGIVSASERFPGMVNGFGTAVSVNYGRFGTLECRMVPRYGYAQLKIFADGNEFELSALDDLIETYKDRYENEPIPTT